MDEKTIDLTNDVASFVEGGPELWYHLGIFRSKIRMDNTSMEPIAKRIFDIGFTVLEALANQAPTLHLVVKKSNEQ